MLAALRDLRPAVVEARRLHRKLRNENDAIARRLRRITNAEGGLLSVSVEIRHEVEEDAGGRKSYERVGPAGFGRGVDTTTQTFGTVVGEKMFRSKFTPVADLDALIERAANLPQVDNADDAFYCWMCSGVSFKEMSDVVDEIRALDDAFRKLLNSLRSVTYFFTPEFFQRLNTWGQHPSNAFDVSAIVRGGDYILEYDGSVSRFTPDMELLALNPEWPDLEEAITQH